MAKVFIEETTLTAIGDAIRGKEGTTALVPVTDMATRITSLQTGSDPVIKSLEITSNGTYTATDCDGYSPITVNVPQDGAPTDEELTITGSCDHRFANNGWNWIIEKFGNRITTKDINTCKYMFQGSSTLKEIPFQFNIKDTADFDYMFSGVQQITTPPKIRGTIKWSSNTSMGYIFSICRSLRTVEDVFTPEMIEGHSTVKVTSAYLSPSVANLFINCNSLRQLPTWWYKFKLNPESSAFPNYSYTLYYYGFAQCYSLDETTNIPVWRCKQAQTSNMFYTTFSNCHRLKNITFETNEDGSPIVAEWKSQIIDLTDWVGYYYCNKSADELANNVAYRQSVIKDNCYNSGITEDKLIYNDETYQRLKDDPDAYAFDAGISNGGGYYSRYNKISAVNTINSLPDTSAYLATAGGTNTIKFRGKSGSKTDGGAINTLTEEEIAVATAKGWTVTLV